MSSTSTSVPELLRRVPLFATLPADVVERLTSIVQLQQLPAGALLMHEGAPGEYFYIVLEGKVEIIKALGTESERLLGVRGAGSFLGEMSLLSSERQHTASVRAGTPVLVCEMTLPDFDALLHRQPDLAYSMMRILSARLDRAENQTIRELQEKNRELQQAYQDLQAAQAQLIEKEKLEAELRIARDIQRSILPQTRPQIPGFDFGMLIEPMRSVGGDFFDFIPIDDEHLGLAIGDVSGHGVPAAIFMALTFSLLRAEALRTSSPGEALRAVNRRLLGMNQAGMFVTVLYGILNRVTREFQFARAGHDLPLALDGACRPIPLAPGPGLMLGLFAAPPIDEQSVVLPPGSLLLLYTDGVVEGKNAAGEFFGEQRLQAILFAGRKPTAQAACEAVLSAVRDFCDYAPQQDDITLLALQATTSSTEAVNGL